MGGVLLLKSERILMQGNEAMARGLVENGCVVATSYPGTPASEILSSVMAWQKAEGLGEAGGPGHCAVLLRLGRAYGNLLQYDLARDWLQGCLAESDGSCRETCRFELAQTWCFSGNWQEARDVLEPLVTTEGTAGEDASVAAFLLADVYQNLGETAKARDLLTRILASHPNPKAVQAKLDQLLK